MDVNIDTNKEHEHRISRLEWTDAHREEREKSMAADLAKIAHAVAELAEERGAIKRVFESIHEHARLIGIITARIDEHERDRLKYIIDGQKKKMDDIDKKRSEFWGVMLSTFLMSVGTVLAGMALYHFGVKP